MTERRRQMGELEEEVLAEMWAAGRPLTPGEVREAMTPPLAYNTVTTTLQRLYHKGMASRERRGRAYAYQPRQSSADLLAHRMLAHIEHAGDPEAILASFVDGLSHHDAAALRRVLDDLDPHG